MPDSIRLAKAASDVPKADTKRVNSTAEGKSRLSGLRGADLPCASTLDLLHTLTELETWRVSVIAMNGLAFDLSTPHGRMMATIIAGIAEFERELIQERIRSGIAAAKARGKRLGRQPGQRPKSDRLAPKVLALVATGRSYRLIGRELGLSKNTVAEIVKRERAEQPGHHPIIVPDLSRLG